MVETHLTMPLIMFLVFTTVQHVACDRFYIVTSPDQPCPGEFTGDPCITMEQYIRGDYVPNPGTTLQTQITLELLPGNHNINSKLWLSNIASFTMKGSRDATATIACDEQQRIGNYFNFTSIPYVNISHVTFSNCKSARFQSLDMLAIESSHFQNHNFVTLDHVSHAVVIGSSLRNGHRLHVESSSVLVKYSSFSHLYVATERLGSCSRLVYGGAMWSNHSTVTVENSVFTRNSAICTCGYSFFSYKCGWGGAVYASNTQMTITNSTFTSNNAALAGGAVYVIDSSIQIHGSSFSFNSELYLRNTIIPKRLDNGGGALYVTGRNGLVVANQTRFSSNRAKATGGAVYVSSNNTMVTIKQSIFFENTAERSGGGAMNIIGNDTAVYIRQSNFTDNVANTTTGGGGAIYFKGQRANISLAESVFSNNSAAHCAVLDLLEDSNHFVSITSSTFTNNTAKGRSTGHVKDDIGGVACINSASISILNSSFRQNEAPGHAGVLYIEDSTLSVQESIFDGNSAGRNGGVMYARFSPIEVVVIQSLFTNNQAGMDGGVIYVGRAGSQVTVRESSFSDNNATRRGGVIAIVGSQLDVNTTDMQRNVATFGGVISACNSDVIVSDDLLVTDDPTIPICTLYDEQPCTMCTSTSGLFVETTDTTEIPTSTMDVTTSTITETPEKATTHTTSPPTRQQTEAVTTVVVKSEAITQNVPPTKDSITTLDLVTEARTTPTTKDGVTATHSTTTTGSEVTNPLTSTITTTPEEAITHMTGPPTRQQTEAVTTFVVKSEAITQNVPPTKDSITTLDLVTEARTTSTTEDGTTGTHGSTTTASEVTNPLTTWANGTTSPVTIQIDSKTTTTSALADDSSKTTTPLLATTTKSRSTNLPALQNQNEASATNLENFTGILYTALGISLFACVLVIGLLIMVTGIVLYLCGVFKTKATRMKLPDDNSRYVFVSMNEEEHTFSHNTTPPRD